MTDLTDEQLERLRAFVPVDHVGTLEYVDALVAEVRRRRAAPHRALTADEIDSLGGLRDHVAGLEEYWHGKYCAESYRDALKLLDRLLALAEVTP